MTQFVFGILATRICRDRNGRLVTVPHVLNYSRPVSVEVAIEKVKAGKTVFVEQGAEAAVLDAVRDVR